MKNIFRLVGLLLLLIILYQVDWGVLKQSLERIQIWVLLTVSPLFLLALFLRFVRWDYLVKILGIDLSTKKNLIYFTAAMFWSLVTPGKVGELSRIIYINKDGVPIGKAVFSVLIDRLVDLSFLLFLSLLGVTMVSQRFYWGYLLLILVILFVVIWQKDRILLCLQSLLISMVPKKYSTLVQDYCEKAFSGLSHLSIQKHIKILIISSLIWISYIIPLFILALHIGINVSPLVLIVAIVLSAAIAVLPISIAGIGTRDAFLVFYLGQQGVSKEVALLFSFMFIYFYFICLLVGFIAYLLKQWLDMQLEKC